MAEVNNLSVKIQAKINKVILFVVIFKLFDSVTYH